MWFSLLAQKTVNKAAQAANLSSTVLSQMFNETEKAGSMDALKAGQTDNTIIYFVIGGVAAAICLLYCFRDCFRTCGEELCCEGMLRPRR